MINTSDITVKVKNMNACLKVKLTFAFLLAFQIPGWGILSAHNLKIPYVSLSPTAGPLWIAYEAGLFKKNNLSAELLYIPGGSVMRGLASLQADSR